MKARISQLIMVLLLIVGMLAQVQAQDTHQERENGVEQMQASEVIQDWPEVAKEAAQSMIEKYGEPDGVTPDRIHWNEAGDWGLTIVQKEEIEHNFPMPHKDVLYQEIKYEVPVEKLSSIIEYDGSVIVERTKGTMAARCDKEGANYLAVNLAHEVANGEKTVDEARQFYADTMEKMMMQGESSEYLEGFLFDIADDTGDKDLALLEMPDDMNDESEGDTQ